MFCEWCGDELYATRESTLREAACEKNFSDSSSDTALAPRRNWSSTLASAMLSGCRSAGVRSRSEAWPGASTSLAKRPWLSSSLAIYSARPLTWNAIARGLVSSRTRMSSTGIHSGATR